MKDLSEILEKSKVKMDKMDNEIDYLKKEQYTYKYGSKK